MVPKKNELDSGLDFSNPLVQLLTGLLALMIGWFFLSSGRTPEEKAILRQCFGIVIVAGLIGAALVVRGNSLPMRTENGAKEYNGGAVVFWISGTAIAFIWWVYKTQMMVAEKNVGKLFNP